MEHIKSVTVVTEAGETKTWTGHGSVSTVRTPRAATGTPVLRDDDISYVQVVLTYPRED